MASVVNPSESLTTSLPIQSSSPYVQPSSYTTTDQPSSQSSSKSLKALGNALSQYNSIKLDRYNFLLWKNMVLPVIKGHRLEGFINGKTHCPPKIIFETISDFTFVEVQQNPDFENWITHDQLLLRWLYNSMTADIASQIIGHETSQSLWKDAQELTDAHSKANVIFYKREFQNLQKGSMKIDQYLKSIKNIADNLTLAGHPVEIADLVSQVLAGLDSNDYNPVVLQVNEKELISWVELQSTLLSSEKILEQINGSLNNSISLNQVSANYANRYGFSQNKS
ncbi:hypothetical protein EZV62_010383 [Acer yangbiense]|uniref:Retrotransposon Copia-like N-terminal domain-containing protein n=1 Tax=Acer yangbiense TaxID=1000413 RepID=A0A5C7I376_9ROSI|nr:hypothetical protein EZV62_010383 [Acer yangbiense]